jgi:hypothetical protein
MRCQCTRRPAAIVVGNGIGTRVTNEPVRVRVAELRAMYTRVDNQNFSESQRQSCGICIIRTNACMRWISAKSRGIHTCMIAAPFEPVNFDSGPEGWESSQFH